jgi:D-alanine-D-alanine ligase
VLPIPEMVFVDYPPDKPRIVDYSAKWSNGSFESAHTERRFGLESTDPRLAERTEQLVSSCWTLFGLRGYARIDLRVDAAGAPWIIDVNANPSLEADAGFAAATAEIGLSYDATIEHIVAAARAAGITHANV